MEERDNKKPEPEESVLEDLELEDLMSDEFQSDEINLADLGIEESSESNFEPVEFDIPDEESGKEDISEERIPEMTDLLGGGDKSEEPIALSNDELANILSDTESTEEFTYSHVEGEDFDFPSGESEFAVEPVEPVDMEEMAHSPDLEIPGLPSGEKEPVSLPRVDESGFHFDDVLDLDDDSDRDQSLPTVTSEGTDSVTDFPSDSEIEDLEDLEMPSDEEMELHHEDEEFLTSLPELGLDDLELKDRDDESEVGVQVDKSFEEEFGAVRETDELREPDTDSGISTGMGKTGGFSIDEDEGPITLSEAELGNIMDDVEDSEPIIAEPEALPPLEYLEEPEKTGVQDQPEILLSDEELQSALLDTEDIADTSQLAEISQPSPPSVLDEGDEGPITLTAEELGNIISDTEEEAIDATAEFPPDTLDDEEKPPSEETVSILDSDEDEGPVALSENELSAILEDVEEAPAHDEDMEGFLADETAGDEEFYAGLAGDEGAGIEDHFTLPGGAPETMAGTAAAAVTARESSGVIDEISRDQALNKEELRVMIGYLDQLFDQLPDDTVREFSKSEYFDLYKKIMTELGL